MKDLGFGIVQLDAIITPQSHELPDTVPPSNRAHLELSLEYRKSF